MLPYKCLILRRLSEKLPVALHSKFLRLMMLAFNVNSKPVFWSCPILLNTLLNPVIGGMARSISKSLVIFLYTSIEPLKISPKSPKSKPILYDLARSHFNLLFGIFWFNV